MSLQRCAEIVLTDCLHVTENEELGIVQDEETSIVRAIEQVARDQNFTYRFIEIPTERQHSSPIPGAKEDLSACDAVVAPTGKSISHSPETTEAREEGTRFITMPGITEEIFRKIQDANPESIDRLNEALHDRLRTVSEIEISTPSGTDITLSVDPDRGWHRDGMVVNDPGGLANLPAGEVFTAPLETRASGTIFIDRWRQVKPEHQARIDVENGRIQEWNDSAEQYVSFLKEGGENGLVIAELGIGTNQSHDEPNGHILHDEKIYGTCHIAFGMNTSLGGENEAEVHEDVILLDPEITADGDKIDAEL